METCISEHILEDFFKTRGDEVRKVMQFDMRWERREKLIREEEYDVGYAAGEVQGEARGEARGYKAGVAAGEAQGYIDKIRAIQRKIKKGKTLAEIADDLEVTEESVQSFYELIQEKGVDCPAEEIYGCLQEISTESTLEKRDQESGGTIV